MKKFASNCGLKLHITKEGATYSFKFTQPPLGGYLATIRTNQIERQIHLNSKFTPDWFTKFFFHLTSGIHNYELAYRLVDDKYPRHYANLYRCIDRQKRERFFAQIHEVETECGGAFLIDPEDYKALSSQIEEIQQPD